MKTTVTDKLHLERQPRSLWDLLCQNRLTMIALGIVAFYFFVALCSAVGLIADNWADVVGPSYGAPAWDFIFGTDIFGRSVFLKMIKGAEIAVSVGFVTATLAVMIGTTMGSLAGYFGGRVDDFIVWVYSVFTSIPDILLIIVIAFVLGKGILSVYLALGLTSWVGVCRIVRAEVMRHREREYVQAAQAIGGGHLHTLTKHIFPNIFHLVLINFSLQFHTAIQSEVILSYLGLGVQGVPSWGKMIDDAKVELGRGVWWQLAGAVLAMFLLLWAVNILIDALRDALDPKLRGARARDEKGTLKCGIDKIR